MVNNSPNCTLRRVVKSVLVSWTLAACVGMGIGNAAQAQAGNAAKSLARKAAAASPKTDEKHPASKASVRPVESGLRDPFKTPPPLVERPSGAASGGEMTILSAPLPPGPRGLNIDQIKLEGIVRQGKTNPKMIAVLANSANRAFFLHENDVLHNGVITKITPDSVYFSEEVRDATGKTSTREVVKRLAPGEKK